MDRGAHKDPTKKLRGLDGQRCSGGLNREFGVVVVVDRGVHSDPIERFGSPNR